MVKRFLIQLTPIAVVAAAYFALETRVGGQPGGKVWIYSSVLERGASMSPKGLKLERSLPKECS